MKIHCVFVLYYFLFFIKITNDMNSNSPRLPPAERRNYSNVFNALTRIAKEEGVVTMWRGAIPTMGRAMVVNAAQLASYSQAKQSLMSTGKFHCPVIFCV